MATKKEKTTQKKNTKTTSHVAVEKIKTVTKAAPKTTRKLTRTKTEAPMIVRKQSEPTFEDIAQRAYLLFERRGYRHGHDVEDWMQAEKELRAGL